MVTTAQYEKALTRAHDEGLAVTLLESWGAHVANPAHDGYYTVRNLGHHLSCNCPAGERGNYCKHRALVHEAMVVKSAPVPATVTKAWLEMSRDERAAFLRGITVNSPETGY